MLRISDFKLPDNSLCNENLSSIFCILSSVFCLLFSVFYHLHLSRILYKSAPFMQNKPNFQDVQMNVNIYYTKVYKNETALGRGQNKPNSNPNKPNFQKAQINVNSFITKNYRKKDVFSVRINKPNFQNDQNERKLNFNKGLQKKRLFSSQKNKPNSNPISSKAKIACRKIRPHPQVINGCNNFDFCL